MTAPPLRDVRTLLPWLPLPPFVLPDSSLDRLRGELRQSGYDIAEIDAGAVGDERALLELVGAVLAFPDFYGANWDALEDCIGMVGDDEAPVGLVVTTCERFLVANVHDFARCVHLLTDVAERTFTTRTRFRLDVFFVGSWP